MAANYKNNFRCDVRPCSLVYMYKFSGKKNCCPHLQGIKTYRQSRIIFQETGILQKYLVLTQHILQNMFVGIGYPTTCPTTSSLLQACARIYQ